MRVINGLIDQGIEVITDRTHLVHVSGHPRPRRARRHDRLGAAADRDPGARRGAAHGRACRARAPRRRRKVMQCRDGDLVRLAPGAPAIIDEVPAGRLYKDGSLLVERRGAHRRRPPPAGLCRRGFGRAGVERARASCSAIRRSRLTGIPEDRPRWREHGEDIAYDAVIEAFESMPRARRRDPDAVAEAVRRAVRAALAQRLGQEADMPRARARGVVS